MSYIFSRKKVASSQLGMSLIEVMIAVFVLAIGMLGMLALLTSAKQANFEAQQRTSAVIMAQDILGRIRRNSVNAASYNGIVVGDGSISSVDCSATCTAVTQFDTYEWEQNLMGVAEQASVNGNQSNTGGLVSPRGCVTVQGRLVTVAIAWRGLQVLSNPTLNACGSGGGLYGTGDAQRQLLVVQSYIEPVKTF